GERQGCIRDGLLHLRVAQSGAARIRETQGTSLLPDLLRRSGAVPKHHVYSAGSDAIGHRRNGVAVQEQRQEFLHDWLGLYLAAHDHQDREGHTYPPWREA